MISFVLAAQLADVVTFLTMVRVLGPESEANPIVRWLLEGHLGLVLAAKVAVLAFALAAAALQRPRLQLALVASIVAISAVGALSNLATIDAAAPRPPVQRVLGVSPGYVALERPLVGGPTDGGWSEWADVGD